MKHRLISILIMALAMTTVLGGCRKKHQATDTTENAVTETATEETSPEEETSETEEETEEDTEEETETEVESGEAESEDEQVTESATDDIISSENGTEDPTGNHAGTDGNSGTAIASESAPKIVTGVSAKANGIYYVGDTLGAADFTVTVTYSDGTTATNPAGYGVAPLTLAGTSNTLTVSYGGVENTFVVKASERPTEAETEPEETTEGLVGRSTPVESWMVGTWISSENNIDGGVDGKAWEYWIDIYENGKANRKWTYQVDTGEPDDEGDVWYAEDDWGYLDDNNCLVLSSGLTFQVEVISAVIIRVNGYLYVRKEAHDTQGSLVQTNLYGTKWTSIYDPMNDFDETIVIDENGNVTLTEVYRTRVTTYSGYLGNSSYIMNGHLYDCYCIDLNYKTMEEDGVVTYSGKYRSVNTYHIITVAEDTVRYDRYYIRAE